MIRAAGQWGVTSTSGPARNPLYPTSKERRMETKRTKRKATATRSPRKDEGKREKERESWKEERERKRGREERKDESSKKKEEGAREVALLVQFASRPQRGRSDWPESGIVTLRVLFSVSSAVLIQGPTGRPFSVRLVSGLVATMFVTGPLGHLGPPLKQSRAWALEPHDRPRGC